MTVRRDCSFVCIGRILAYSALCSRNPNITGAMTVLFDLPNCIVVSTYVLLTIVWAECFLYSRHHTENTVKWRKFWLGSYMLFNACLYATQIILYILIFWPGPSSDRTNIVRTILYVAMTGINFIAVLLVFLLYLYLNMKFSVSFSDGLINIQSSLECNTTIGVSIQITSSRTKFIPNYISNDILVRCKTSLGICYAIHLYLVSYTMIIHT